MKRLFYFLAFPLLLFLSLFPRSVEVINHNYLFLLDQGRDYMAVRNIVVNHHLTLIGSEIGGGYAGITGIFQGPFHYYFLSIPFILFNGDPYGGIVLMLLWSLASIVLGFVVVQKIFGKPFGLFAAFLLALSPPLISAARFVWNPHPSIFFILLAFYFIYLVGVKKNLSNIFFAGFFTVFTYNFEIAMTIPLVIALLLYVLFVERLTIKQYIFLFVGLLFPFLPFLLFEVRHNFLAIHGLMHYLSQPHDSKGYGLINNHLDSFFLNAWDSFPHLLNVSQRIFALFLIAPTIFFTLQEKNKYIKHLLVYFFSCNLYNNFCSFIFAKSYFYVLFTRSKYCLYLFLCFSGVFGVVP